jgi:ribosome production factor 1
MLPNAELYYRRGLDLKKIIPQAKEKDFTDIMVINEDRKEPSIFDYCVIN